MAIHQPRPAPIGNGLLDTTTEYGWIIRPTHPFLSENWDAETRPMPSGSGTPHDRPKHNAATIMVGGRVTKTHIRYESYSGNPDETTEHVCQSNPQNYCPYYDGNY